MSDSGQHNVTWPASARIESVSMPARCGGIGVLMGDRWRNDIDRILCVGYALSRPWNVPAAPDLGGTNR